MKKKQKCYIYTRVSTAIQVEGYSLEAQRDKLTVEPQIGVPNLLQIKIRNISGAKQACADCEALLFYIILSKLSDNKSMSPSNRLKFYRFPGGK